MVSFAVLLVWFGFFTAKDGGDGDILAADVSLAQSFNHSSGLT